jgi:molecular chaperone IbpA
LDRVDEDARFEDGLLRINLARMVPEALKPRPIAIAAAGDNDAKVEHKNAA